MRKNADIYENVNQNTNTSNVFKNETDGEQALEMQGGQKVQMTSESNNIELNTKKIDEQI